MNRRQALKTLTVAGLMPWATRPAARHLAVDGTSFFLVTDRPTADPARLVRLLGLDPSAISVTTRSMDPAAQDLSLFRRGHLVDPTRSAAVAPPLADLAAELRARPQPGAFLVTLTSRPSVPGDAVVFEVDGRVYDQVPLDRSFGRIVVPGAQGPTTFELRDGRLSVVSSSCRHQLCKKMGPRTDGALVCAPNRLVATLPPPAPSLFDAVTG